MKRLAPHARHTNSTKRTTSAHKNALRQGLHLCCNLSPCGGTFYYAQLPYKKPSILQPTKKIRVTAEICLVHSSTFPFFCGYTTQCTPTLFSLPSLFLSLPLTTPAQHANHTMCSLSPPPPSPLGPSICLCLPSSLHTQRLLNATRAGTGTQARTPPVHAVAAPRALPAVALSSRGAAVEREKARRRRRSRKDGGQEEP